MENINEKIRELRNQSKEDTRTGFERVVEYFTSEEGIFGKTRLTASQRNMLYVYSLMHIKHPKWGCDKAAIKLAHLFISEDGKSRSETIELFRGLLAQFRNESLSVEMNGKEQEQKR